MDQPVFVERSCEPDILGRTDFILRYFERVKTKQKKIVVFSHVAVRSVCKHYVRANTLLKSIRNPVESHSSHPSV